jgi:hypothetical protein
MDNSNNLNEHHIWDGQYIQNTHHTSPRNGSENDQSTFVPASNQLHPSSQRGFIASSSDNLFHPVPENITTPRVFSLPNVPFNPNPHYHAYNRRSNTPLRQIPTHSSSYNNPTFAIPPVRSNIVRNNPPIAPLGVTSPIPPRAHSQPVYEHFQPYYPGYHPLPYPLNPSPITPTSSVALPTISKTLPSVSHISILTSKLDFFAWDEGVTSLIRANGLIGHILDPSEPVDPTRPDRIPAAIPILSVPPLPEDLAALNRWWDEDNIAQHILVSRLGSIPRGLLPSPNLTTRTALSIYRMLSQYYGTSSFADCNELLNTLNSTLCTSGRVQEYVSKWRTGIARLQSARFPFSVKVCISQFVRGLPLIAAFTPLRADLPHRVAGAGDQDFGAFLALTETVMELDTIFRTSSLVHNPRSNRTPAATQPPSAPSTSSNSSAPSAPDPMARPAKQTCANCKARGLRFTGHTDGTCFQPGGGMEGRREEYLSNRGRIHAMFVEYLENALDLQVPVPQDRHSSPPSTPSSPSLPILDGDVVLPPVANLCVPTSFAPNTDVNFDLYSWCDSSFKNDFRFASPAVDFSNSAFISLVSLYNALLDSGCTHHIIRDRDMFYNYIKKEISVGTANCGSLDALGTGDVDFRYPYGNRTVVFTLRGCLHAPSAPINLLSVGALVEHGMSCLFSPGGITKLYFSDDHPVLPDFVFRATVSNRLSFLKLNFICPTPSRPAVSTEPSVSLPVVLPAVSMVSSEYSFPRLRLDLMLWHRRFGHIGMDATRAALTKDYVTGVLYDGPLVRDHCIACIVGKSPQQPYSHNGHRATKVGELLHMDLCGPYPVQGPRGEKYFFNILDDKSNFAFTFGIKLKSDAFTHYRSTEAFLERSNDVRVLTIRCGGELELTAGKMGEHLVSKGIVIQRTVAYAHEQNGKSERYIRTLEEGGQALLAGAGLPMSFWLDAVLTRQYLCNRLPTSTLPNNVTPYESITNGKKPDLSHLRVWGCDCYVAVPDELRPKAGFKRFRAIFVGYEEHRIGWRVRDLQGRYSFSNDVVFNENLSGRLGVPRTPSSLVPDAPSRSTSPRLHHDISRTRTAAGSAFDEVIRLKEFRRAERAKKRSQLRGAQTSVGDVEAVAAVATDSVVDVVDVAVDVVDVDVDGILCADVIVPAIECDHGGALEDFLTYLVSSSPPRQVETDSLETLEADAIRDWRAPILSSYRSEFLTVDQPEDPVAFHVSSSSSPVSFRSFDLSKAPSSYAEAVARSDAPVWRTAMDREKLSLEEMGAFEEVDLPKGERTIGLKWVFAHKTDTDGMIIRGKEKARLVAQGFNQRPGQYDETYAPVAKLSSVRILLTWAAVRDLDVYQFDCKTAFLHAKIRHPIYCRRIPGYPVLNPNKALRILVALYGLRQSAFEFYTLFSSLLISMGMRRCDVDHGVFVGRWNSPPDPLVSMPVDGGPLVIFVPLHVDDGLAITNSFSLYSWFLATLAQRLLIVDLGPCSKFLGIVVLRDRPNRRIWLSSHLYVSELLEEWNLSSCKPAATPLPSHIADISPAPLNSLPNVSDEDLTSKYQRIVGCLLYLAVSTRPDIAYSAMWLGQFNAKPSRAHFLAAKHVLRYLSGTRNLALCLGSPSSRVPLTLRGYLQNMGCSDADWASDAADRKSISGYSFYFEGSLVSWSAVKQKSIALSSTEAEYYAMSHAFKEALWLRAFLTFLDFPVPRPFPILSDNQAACSLSNSLAISARSKHIDIRHHFIREHIQSGSFSTTWVPTEDMPADIFTKSLSFPIFSRHRDVLGLSIPPSLL